MKPNIKKTKWAKRFKEDAPVSFDKALQIASADPCRVTIYYNNELGEYLYAVVSSEVSEFWLDAFETEEEAMQLIEEMGWELYL